MKNPKAGLNKIRQRILQTENRQYDIIIERKQHLQKKSAACFTMRPLRHGESYVQGVRRIENGYVYETVDKIDKTARAENIEEKEVIQ